MKKNSLTIGAIVLLFIIFAIWMISIELAVKTGMQFVVAPDDINVIINDKTYNVDYMTSIELKPGNYHIKLSRSDFKSDEQDVAVSKNKITKVFSALEPANEKGKKLINSSLMDERRRVIFGSTSIQGPNDISNRYPFVDKLPIVEKYFVITPCYGPDNNQDFGVCIALAADNPTIRENAIKAMKDKSIDTTNTPIYFHQSNP